MRSILIILFFTLLFISVNSYAQKWQPGRFVDVKGNIETGLLRVDPSGRGPIKGEGFIEFKPNAKADSYKLSASDLKYFIAGPDSFIVAHAPKKENWGKRETDFVKVALDEDVKLYVSRNGSGGGGRGISFGPDVGVGFGSGGYGGGIGGGISIPIGGGGGDKNVYYYGANPAEMQRLTNQNFQDIMTDIMGDYPDLVNQIQRRQYTLGNIDKLIAKYQQLENSDPNQQ